MRVHGYCFPPVPFTRRRRISFIKPGSRIICGALRRRKMPPGITCTRRPMARMHMSFKYGLMRITGPWPACYRAHPGPPGAACQASNRHLHRRRLASRPSRGPRKLRRHPLSCLRKCGRRPQARRKMVCRRRDRPSRRYNPRLRNLRRSPRHLLSRPCKHGRHPQSRQKIVCRRRNRPSRRCNPRLHDLRRSPCHPPSRPRKHDWHRQAHRKTTPRSNHPKRRKTIPMAQNRKANP